MNDISEIALTIQKHDTKPIEDNSMQNYINSADFQKSHEENQVKLMLALGKLMEMGFTMAEIMPQATKFSFTELAAISADDLISRIISDIDFSRNPNNLLINQNLLDKTHLLSKSNQNLDKNQTNQPQTNITIDNPDVCSICTLNQNYQDNELNSKVILEGCKHHFCKSCLHEFLLINLKEKNIKGFICPFFECKMALEEQFALNIFTADEQAKLKEVKEYDAIANNPNIIFCKCGKKCERKDANETKIQCLECDTFLCFLCKNQFHENLTCKEYLESLLMNAVDGVNTKQCPNCKAAITKNLGCKHMTCVICKWEFCWVCMQKWNVNTDDCVLPQQNQIRNEGNPQPQLGNLLRPESYWNLATFIWQTIVGLYAIGGLIFSIYFELNIYNEQYFSEEKCTTATFKWIQVLCSFHFTYIFIFILKILQKVINPTKHSTWVSVLLFIFSNICLEGLFVTFIGISCQQGMHKNCDFLSIIMICYIIMNAILCCEVWYGHLYIYSNNEEGAEY